MMLSFLDSDLDFVTGADFDSTRRRETRGKCSVRLAFRKLDLLVIPTSDI
jgi:hypothetical protein